MHKVSLSISYEMERQFAIRHIEQGSHYYIDYNPREMDKFNSKKKKSKRNTDHLELGWRFQIQDEGILQHNRGYEVQ